MADGLFGSLDAASEGGKARARNLNKERRSEIARRAADSRWAKEGKPATPHATHGSEDHPLRIGEIEIPCFVLSDGRRVLTTNGMIRALGLSKGGGDKVLGGNRLARFSAGKSILPFVSEQVKGGMSNPIDFRLPNGVPANGFDATLLADLCEVVLAARNAGALMPQQLPVAKRCEILVRGFAKVGIIALVDEVTGYQSDRARDALSKILEAFVAKELQKWVSTFRLDYYEYLFKLWKIPYNPANPTMKRPQFFGVLTNNIVYDRLAPGVREELCKRNPLNEKGKRPHKHFQHLTPDLGHPKLKEHLAAVTALMRASPTKEVFMKMLDAALPKYKAAPLFNPPPDRPALPQSPS